MKQAYVSVVLRWERDVSLDGLRQIDRIAAEHARAHEIVLVCSPQEALVLRERGLLEPGVLSGPLSAVVMWHNTSRDQATVAGLARAAGDFVLEWNADPGDLSGEVLRAALAATDDGFEVVELVPERVASLSRLFFGLANLFRPRVAPLVPSVARLFSRRGLDAALQASMPTASRTLMVADMGLPRTELIFPLRYRSDHSYRDRRGEAFTVITRGTNLARVVPMVASVLLGAIALGSAVFAAVLYFVRGKAPEGWTTMMVVLGLGLATLIGLVAVLYERVDALSRPTGEHQSVSNVLVVPSLLGDPEDR